MKGRAKIILSHCFFVTVFLVTLFNFQKVLAETANHIVISEVQIAGANTTDDFIELYNPTDQNQLLDGFRLVKRTKVGNTDTTLKSFGSTDIIPAFGFYLWANSNYTTISAIPDSTTAGTIAADNGIALRQGAENTGTIIDSVGWGAAANIFVEGSVFATNPAANNSLERKASAASTSLTMLPTMSEDDKGNGEDTGVNSADFIIRNAPDPQNTTSPIETPADYIPPQNQNPVADCGEDQTVFKNTEASFDGSASYDPDGTISDYLWDFGDSSSDQADASANHSYNTAGNFTVTLKVTDNKGAESSDTCTVNVIEKVEYSKKILINEFLPAPGSIIDWDGNGTADSNDEWIELINLDENTIDLGKWTLDDVVDGGSDPYVIPDNTLIDPDGFLVFYKKDTGLVLNNTGDSVVLKNPDGDIVDQYSFTSAASDKSFSRDGNSATSTWVTGFPPSPGKPNNAPGNNPPVANAGASINNAKVGEALNFNGSASSDSDGSIVDYEWSFGDGITVSGENVNHVYSNIGTYMAILTVRDNDGATSTSSITVTIVAGEVQYQNQFSSDIKVSEILPNPTGSDTDGEYIKINNFGSQDVNLRNWSLDDEDGGSKPFKIDYDLILKPKDEAAFYSADTKISLNNDGDHARIFDPDNKLVDDISYSGPVVEGAVYSLENGKWVWKNNLAENTSPPVADKSSSPSSPSSADVETKIEPTITPSAEPKVPNLQKIAVAEPLLNSNPQTGSANKVLETSSIGEIVVSSGTLVSSSTNKNSNPDAEQDFSSSSLASSNNTLRSQTSSNGLIQKPAIIVIIMVIILLLSAKILIYPEDWKKISQKLFVGEKEVKDEFEDLFK